MISSYTIMQLVASLLITLVFSGCGSSENERTAADKINFKVDSTPAIPAREAKAKNLNGSPRDQHKNYPLLTEGDSQVEEDAALASSSRGELAPVLPVIIFSRRCL